MTPRYYFALPDLHKPVGGHNIQYRIADTLHDAGYDVALLHEDRHHRYPYFETTVPGWHCPDLANLTRPGMLQRIKHLKSEGMARRKRIRAAQPHPVLKRSARDVFVLPEFIYGEYARVFPGAPLILAAQDVFGLARAYRRDVSADTRAQHPRLAQVYATSDASRAAVRTLLGHDPQMIGLPIDGEALRALPKKVQIAYMPRKLKEESDLVLTALRSMPSLSDIPILPIVGMSDAERDRALRESLIFLSFSDREGFGLPPAEAMAAECIVIGYTGVGGNEYFTPDTGFPVQGNDIIGMIRAVERVVRDYRANPAALDALRRNAARHIRETYAPDSWAEAVRKAWQVMERALTDRLRAET